VNSRAEAQKRQQRVLDGFLLLYSCRVKLPHEAIRSKLASENIVDVTEEDLEFFKNLTYLDISDNFVQMHQLANLVALEELDMQYNNMTALQLLPDMFPQLHTVHLSYNKIPKEHLSDLGHLTQLQVLNLASNNLCTLPLDMSYL
jgi:Leucine-rich repeat (LRR) protein